MFWLGQLIRSLEMFFKTVSYELNWKYWLAISAIQKSDKNSENFSEYFGCQDQALEPKKMELHVPPHKDTSIKTQLSQTQ